MTRSKKSTTLLHSPSSLLRSRRLPRTKPNNWLRCAPAYLLMIISMMISLFATLSSAAPLPGFPTASKAPGDDDNGNNDLDDVLGDAREGPYNISTQAKIAGAILIILGFILCFFGYRIYYVTLFIAGFYFLGNLSYIGMANAGVSSYTLLLVISIIVGIIGGLFLIFCSRLGAAVLGALAFYAVGLWILGWKSGGVITNSSGRISLLVVLAVIGFVIGLFNEKEMVIVASAIVGAYSFVVGVDMYAHTGFTSRADSFINSRNSVESHFEDEPAGAYALLGTFLVMAILGMLIQFYSWGRTRTFRPVAAVAPVVPVAPVAPVAPAVAGAPGTAPIAPVADPVYTEKPVVSRWGRFFGRRY
ncbi:hypothetical protein BX616_010481 [Lobosporangium transversale]|uniref:Transmembrane protein 198 n=1 Tax=Lobosporangium transversale TaxID=64571 RepID=A0A1Y2GT66_9FUNG|nr:hypothetical protein BCR41DRAFT_384996 [Lobosporangium transversale]KAF9911786.1 hypothetical protein BX616_010481 [Lobosporangium transversale]ORZ22678.1 hypothetical protein BCR41DRAFT_384996 [Lobosporangium transversale]|eukprot:XP_021883232.1 hypothetical protein BCR41DRAFT_384996 [Lobosporangium transversale]